MTEEATKDGKALILHYSIDDITEAQDDKRVLWTELCRPEGGAICAQDRIDTLHKRYTTEIDKYTVTKK